MKTDDDAFLSAYLDDELDPHQRSCVESAIHANPALTEQYRQLIVVRDLVANLSRPTLTEDLSTSILAQASARCSRGLRSRLRSVKWLGLGLAAAALTLISVGLAVLSGRPSSLPPHARPFKVANRKAPTAQPASIPHARSVASITPVSTNPETPARPHSEAVPTARPSLVIPHDEVALQEDRDQRRIRELLDSPDLRHVFVVVDELGGGAPARVESLVQHMPRLDPVFGKITVSQGIVIDPKHPNKATVFALVMNEQEVQRFRAQLKEDFPSQQVDEQQTPDPAVVTQLSGIGQMVVYSGTRATELAAAPTEDLPKTALKTLHSPKSSATAPDFVLANSPEFDGLRVPVVPRRPPPSSDTPTVASAKSSPEHERSESPASPAMPDPSNMASIASATERSPTDLEVSSRSKALESAHPRSSIVLVWVTSQAPPLKGRH